MGKKFMNTVLFLAVTVAAATLTAYVGKGSGNVLLYNFTFLGLKNRSICRRSTAISGRTMLPRTGGMPARPALPVPRIK